MFSNKTQQNIEACSSTLPGIHAIAKNYDLKAGTVVRAKKHKKTENGLDESKLIDDVFKLRPFEHIEGHSYTHFKNIQNSYIKGYDGFTLRNWFEQHKNDMVL